MIKIIPTIIALTNLYGMVRMRMVVEIYNSQHEDLITLDDVESVVINHADELKRSFISVHRDYFVIETIIEHDEFDSLLRMKGNKPYYIPEKNELLKYVDNFYFEKTKMYDDLIVYLQKNFYKHSRDSAERLAEDIQGMCQYGSDIQQILEMFEKRKVYFKDLNQTNEVMRLVMALSNNTRIWENNGHTPLEIFERFEKPSLKPLPNAIHKANQLNKLWKPVNRPFALKETLNLRTKNELVSICHAYGINGVSQLNKDALVDELSCVIPIFYDRMIKRLDVQLYDFMKILSEHGCVLYTDAISTEMLRIFADYCIAFTGSLQGEKVLYLPDELINAFKGLDHEAIRKQIDQNTTFLRLIKGLLYYYGIMSTYQLSEKINQYLDHRISYIDFLTQIHFFNTVKRPYYKQGTFVSYVYDEHIREIYAKIQARKDLSDYPFSKDELMEAGESKFLESTAPIKELQKLLANNYRMDEETIYHTLSSLILLIKSGANMEEVFGYMQSVIEYPSYEYSRKIAGILMNLNDQTRQWVLKGHKPVELKREVKSQLPLKSAKVGRNDLCPCGSGKKYKKCCG